VGWRSGTKKKNDSRVDELIEDKTSDTMYRWIHESKILAINMNWSCRLLPKRVSESTEWFACIRRSWSLHQQQLFFKDQHRRLQDVAVGLPRRSAISHVHRSLARRLINAKSSRVLSSSLDHILVTIFLFITVVVLPFDPFFTSFVILIIRLAEFIIKFLHQLLRVIS